MEQVSPVTGTIMITGCDVSNAFNEIKREEVLDELWENSDLGEMWYYFWQMQNVKAYIGLGGGTKMKTAPIINEEGMQHGEVEGMPLFTLGPHKVNTITNTELREHGGALMRGADDTYLVGPPGIVFECLHRHKQRLAEVGLEINVNKTKYHIKDQYRNGVLF